MKKLLLLLFILCIPLVSGLELFDLDPEVEVNTTHFTVILEETNHSYLLNQTNTSYNISSLIFRTSEWEDNWLEINKTCSSMNYTNITQHHYYYNSTIQYNYTIFNETSVYAFNESCIEEECNCSDTNLDYFSEYSKCYFNNTIINAEKEACLEDLEEYNGDNTCVEEIARLNKTLGSYSSTGKSCGERIDELEGFEDELKTFKSRRFFYYIIFIAIGALVCFLIMYYNNPKNRGNMPVGEDTEQNQPEHLIG